MTTTSGQVIFWTRHAFTYPFHSRTPAGPGRRDWGGGRCPPANRGSRGSARRERGRGRQSAPGPAPCWRGSEGVKPCAQAQGGGAAQAAQRPPARPVTARVFRERQRPPRSLGISCAPELQVTRVRGAGGGGSLRPAPAARLRSCSAPGASGAARPRLAPPGTAPGARPRSSLGQARTPGRARAASSARRHRSALGRGAHRRLQAPPRAGASSCDRSRAGTPPLSAGLSPALGGCMRTETGASSRAASLRRGASGSPRAWRQPRAQSRERRAPAVSGASWGQNGAESGCRHA